MYARKIFSYCKPERYWNFFVCFRVSLCEFPFQCFACITILFLVAYCYFLSCVLSRKEVVWIEPGERSNLTGSALFLCPESPTVQREQQQNFLPHTGRISSFFVSLRLKPKIGHALIPCGSPHNKKSNML